MREMIKMVIVLTILCSISGTLLAAIYDKTKDRIKFQQLKFVQGPAIKEIFEGSSNDPIVDRFEIIDGDIKMSIFVGKFDGKAETVAFESFGTGYGGKLGVMVGVNTKTDKIIGVRVTTHLETPGVGSRAKTDLTFVSQFKGLSLNDTFKVKTDDGQINAISGATFTSRGVSYAATEAGKAYDRIKPQIIGKLNEFSK